jgi:hypothetical protein
MAEVVNLKDQRQRKRFSDFADEPVSLDGEKTTIKAVLGEDIQILGYRMSKSKFEDSKTGTYTTIQVCRKNGQRYVLFTSSNILARQCAQYASQMPFWTVIRMINRYFTMT